MNSFPTLILFGGKSEEDEYFNQIYIGQLYCSKNNDKRLDSINWTLISFSNNNNEFFVSAREGHSASTFYNELVIFGGKNENSYFNDFLILNVETMKWQKFPTNQSSPSLRAFHSSSFINNNFFIFGGTNGQTVFNDLYLFNYGKFKKKTHKYTLIYE